MERRGHIPANPGPGRDWTNCPVASGLQLGQRAGSAQLQPAWSGSDAEEFPARQKQEKGSIVTCQLLPKQAARRGSKRPGLPENQHLESHARFRTSVSDPDRSNSCATLCTTLVVQESTGLLPLSYEEQVSTLKRPFWVLLHAPAPPTLNGQALRGLHGTSRAPSRTPDPGLVRPFRLVDSRRSLSPEPT